MFRRLLLVALVSIPVCGCGTIINVVDGEDDVIPVRVTEPRSIYGGVATDLGYGTTLLNENSGRWIGLYLLLVDLPASAVGDTLTLPITLYQAWQNQKHVDFIRNEQRGVPVPDEFLQEQSVLDE